MIYWILTSLDGPPKFHTIEVYMLRYIMQWLTMKI